MTDEGYIERWETDEPGEGMAFRVIDQEWDLDADPPVRIIRKIEFLTYGPVLDSPWPIIGVTPAGRGAAVVTGRPVDEAVGPDRARARSWAVGHRQFDLVRASDGVSYLTRWWLVKTPWGGIALHRMTGPDARDTLHDHPFSFVSFVLRGGYLEDRLDPKTMNVEGHRVRRVNRLRAGVDAHAIVWLDRAPTWTLLLVGRHRRTWGFWEREATGRCGGGSSTTRSTPGATSRDGVA